MTIGCPDCDWTFELVAGIEVEHVCGEGDALFCDTCGWSFAQEFERVPGFLHALAQVHLMRVGHPEPVEPDIPAPRENEEFLSVL